MGEITEIEWADATWNPWRGCSKISPGCAHCYMFTGQARFGHDPAIVTRAAAGTFNAPRSPKFEQQREAILATENRRMRVFTCSWSDWFHEAADPWRDEAWEIVRECPNMDFLILTKRPERIAEHLPDDWGDGWPNVWLGVSIENRRFVHRADLLRQVPAAIRFISAEPLLGPLLGNELNDRQLEQQLERRAIDDAATMPRLGESMDDTMARLRRELAGNLNLAGIDWLIVGGESGKGCRPVNPEWVRELRDACAASQLTDPSRDGTTDALDGHGGTRFFFKQWGGRTSKSGGRELDGRTWDQTPLVLAGDSR